MSAIRDAIKKVRFEQGQQSVASPFQFEEGLQTKVPQATLIRNKIREVRDKIFKPKPTLEFRIGDIAGLTPRQQEAKREEFKQEIRSKATSKIPLPPLSFRETTEAFQAILETPEAFPKEFKEEVVGSFSSNILGITGVSPIQQIRNKVSNKVLQSLTRQDLVNITAGRKVSPEKLELFKTISADPTLKEELIKIQRNKKIPLKQKIGKFFDDIFSKAEAPTEPKQIRSAIQKVRAEQKAVVPMKDKITEVEKITGFKKIQDFRGMFQFQDRNKQPFRVILEKEDTVEQMLEKIRKVKKFTKRFEPQVRKLERKFNIFTGEVPESVKKARLLEQKAITPKTPTPKDLQSLAQDFIKKNPNATAEEFVEAPPKVFHGGGREIDKFDARKLTKGGEIGRGVYFSGSKEKAKLYGGTITELKADLKNPLTITKKELWSDGGLIDKFNENPDYTKKLIEQGYDGIIVKEGNIIDQGVVFPSSLDKIKTKSQLKEAFNQAKGVEKPVEIAKDIGVRKIAKAKGLGEAPSPVNKAQKKSIEQTVSETIPPKQSPLKEGVSQELQNSEIVSSLPPSKHIPTTKSIAKEFAEYKKAESGIRGAWVKIRETVQDSFIRMRKLQDRVNKGAKIPDDINVSQAETLFHGKVNAKLEDVRDVVVNIDKEIVKTAKELNMTADKFGNEVDSFLHARHALERNARLGDGAAGLTNTEAQKILNNIDNLLNTVEIKAVAEKIQGLNRKTLQILLDAEVIEKELFDLLNKTYKNHIPLQRVMSEQGDIVQALSGRGFDVKSTGIKKAVGSDKPVADILTNVTANAEQAIIRAEKNLVDLTTLRFARANKGLGVFEEVKPKVIGKTFDEKFIKEQINDPLVLTLREKGKPVFLKINDKQLAVALKGVNVESVPALMRGITYITRLYASLHTRFNYEFAFSNNVRDVQEMMVDVASRKGMGFGASGKAVTKDPQSKKAVFDFLFGRDTEGAKLYQQMRADGGTTGGLGLSTREQVELDIETIRKLNRSKPRQAALKAVETVDKWNTLFEDATRLSVYRTALERGLSRKEAAFLAKESTVNFNKKGTAGPIINGLYMFSNASIQGSTKILRAMKNPKVLGAVITSVGGAVWAVNEWNEGVDPDWRDKVTKWDRSSNLTIMLPTEGEDIKYITVPISWGLKPIKVSLEYIYDASTGQGNLKDATTGVLTSVLESYNPLAGDESVLNTLTPTVLKVPMEISRNRAWYGNSIKPDYDPNIPASAKYFKSLENSLSGRVSIGATSKISEVTDGAIEISPADVNYAYNQYIGGVGRSINRIIDTVVAATTDKELEAKERPILNRFLKETDEEKVLQRLYYSEKERVDKEKAKQKNRDIKRITPIYDTAQMLLEEGKEKEAQAIVDGLSDEDYKIYKKLKASDKRRQTRSKQIQMFRVVEDVQELKKEGKTDEAQAIVDAMTDEEYDAYKAVKKQLDIK